MSSLPFTGNDGKSTIDEHANNGSARATTNSFVYRVFVLTLIRLELGPSSLFQ